MPGLRIYYVPPRLAGRVSEWSGLESPDGRSWLLDRAEDLKFNAIWFSPMQVTTQIEKQHDGKPATGSLYAIRDHFAIDREFSAEPGMQRRSSYPPEERARIDAYDREHLRHFTKKAKEKGITVFADLVFNHVAADHPLVLEENKMIEKIRQEGSNVLPIYKDNELTGVFWRNGTYGEGYVEHFKFKRKADFSLVVGGTPQDPWSDVAEVNYASPEAERFFITGDKNNKGYWKQVIDWQMDLGFDAFRCDVAYKVPPGCWKDIVAYAKDKNPSAVFMAETLGGPDATVERMAEARVGSGSDERPAFDLGMLSTYWWNFRDKWLPEDELPRIQKMAQFGGAGFPDNHDTPETLAGHFNRAFAGLKDRDRAVASLCLRNYAVAALACNSHYMQMGFELCKETQNGVFKGTGSPEEWKKLVSGRGADHALNISDGIRRINEIKESLDIDNTRIVFRDNAPVKNGFLVKIHCAYVDIKTGEEKAEIILLLNSKPEKGPVEIDLKKALNGGDARGFEHTVITGQDEGGKASIGDVMVFYRKRKNPQISAKPKMPLPKI